MTNDATLWRAFAAHRTVPLNASSTTTAWRGGRSADTCSIAARQWMLKRTSRTSNKRRFPGGRRQWGSTRGRSVDQPAGLEMSQDREAGCQVLEGMSAQEVSDRKDRTVEEFEQLGERVQCSCNDPI